MYGTVEHSNRHRLQVTGNLLQVTGDRCQMSGYRIKVTNDMGHVIGDR